MEHTIIYTDGSCIRQPSGHGGWSAIIITNEEKVEISGGTLETTNNIMEMTAVIKALETLTQRSVVEIYSDSAYVVNAFNQVWLYNWKRNGWKSSNRKPVKNKGLWLELDELVKQHEVTFIKVKGHSDNELNNRCDELAFTQAQKYLNLQEVLL